MSRFSVHGSGHFWSVLDGGKTVATFPVWWKADAHADRLERKARIRRRPCLTCGSQFDSDGPHNRMCPACRQQSLYDGAA